MPFSSHSELTQLAEEFVDYQLLREEDIPQRVWDKAKVEDGDKHYRMDVLWHYFSTLKSGDGRQRFKRLSNIAILVLIPHSNADDRVFSMVRKNKTPFDRAFGWLQPSLVYSVKLATKEPCHKFEPHPSVVARAGKVAWEYEEHRKI